MPNKEPKKSLLDTYTVDGVPIRDTRVGVARAWGDALTLAAHICASGTHSAELANRLVEWAPNMTRHELEQLAELASSIAGVKAQKETQD